MSNNYIEKDSKAIEIRRKIFRGIGIIGAIVVGICNLLMIVAGAFSFEAFLLFLFCISMAIYLKKEK